jgi:hypothetical protein
MTMKDERGFHQELREIAPDLAKHEKANGYSVPPAYFRTLPDRVMARIAEEEKQKEGIGAWLERPLAVLTGVLRHPQYALGLATLAIVIVVAAVLFVPQKDAAFTLDISADEALVYVMDNIDAYEAGDLMALDPSLTFDEADLMDLEQAEVDEALELIIYDMDDAMLEEYF